MADALSWSKNSQITSEFYSHWVQRTSSFVLYEATLKKTHKDAFIVSRNKFIVNIVTMKCQF